jgi:two-component system cell cycle sensor histidine kinase/response regulator CckA
VLEASSGEQAIRVSEHFARKIDLLVTDVVMPGMNGPQLAKRLVASRPGMCVLYISGYSDDVALRHSVEQGEKPFLQKPFTHSGLAAKVRQILDGSNEVSASGAASA